MKIVHLGDLHLGYRAYNRLDKNGFNIREKDVLKVFKEALDKIIELNPAAVLIAGDVFHRPRPTNNTMYHTVVLLQKFREQCDIPIVIISGNHEGVKSYESGSVLQILEAIIPRVKVVDIDIENVTLDNLSLNVMCVPYNSLSKFKEYSIKPDKDYKYNILMMHGSFNSPKCAEITKNESAIIEENDIAKDEWNYVALGHYHKFVDIADNIYYSGAIERTSTNIWQEAKQEKGFIEYDLEQKICKFHTLKKTRKVIDIPWIDVEGMSVEEINQKFIDEVDKITKLDKSIIRLTLKNVDDIIIKSLDYKKIRELKKKAVHFRLNIIKKDSLKYKENGNEEEAKQKSIQEYLKEEIKDFDLSQTLEKDVFKDKARQYLDWSMAKCD